MAAGKGWSQNLISRQRGFWQNHHPKILLFACARFPRLHSSEAHHQMEGAAGWHLIARVLYRPESNAVPAQRCLTKQFTTNSLLHSYRQLLLTGFVAATCVFVWHNSVQNRVHHSAQGLVGGCWLLPLDGGLSCGVCAKLWLACLLKGLGAVGRTVCSCRDTKESSGLHTSKLSLLCSLLAGLKLALLLVFRMLASDVARFRYLCITGLDGGEKAAWLKLAKGLAEPSG